MILVLQLDDQIDKSPREKSKNSRKVVYREIMCFHIMKLVYNNFIYIKAF